MENVPLIICHSTAPNPPDAEPRRPSATHLKLFRYTLNILPLYIG